MKKIHLLLRRLFLNRIKHVIPLICVDTSPPSFLHTLYTPIFSRHFSDNQLLTPFDLYCAKQKVFSLKDVWMFERTQFRERWGLVRDTFTASSLFQ